MDYKVVKITVAVLGLILPFHAAISFCMSNTLNETSPISFGVSYKLSSPFFNNFSIEETRFLRNISTKKVVGLKRDLLKSADRVIMSSRRFDLSEDYIPEYKPSIFGLSFLAGYSFDNFRIELESFYEKFDVEDTKGHVVDDNYRYFALLRDNYGGVSDYVTLRNDGIEFYSVMLNGCYNFVMDNTNVIPFSCLGIGGDIINIFNAIRIKPSFQAKVGINYLLSENVSLFIDGYYHGVVGNQYNNLPVQYPVYLFAPAITSAVANLDINYFGGEFGIKTFI